MDLILQPTTSKKLPGLLRAESCFYLSKIKQCEKHLLKQNNLWVVKRERTKGMPNMHPKGQPLLGFPSAWRPFRDFLHYGHPIHMQLHTMFFASRNITFPPLSCPRVAFVPLLLVIISQCLQCPLSRVRHILACRSFPSQQIQPASAVCQDRERDKWLKSFLFIQGLTPNPSISYLKVSGTENRKSKYCVSWS